MNAAVEEPEVGPAKVIALYGAQQRRALVALAIHDGPTLVLSTQEARALAKLLDDAAAASDADAAFFRLLREELGHELAETAQLLDTFRRLRTTARPAACSPRDAPAPGDAAQLSSPTGCACT
jgi:hypothetical protein